MWLTDEQVAKLTRAKQVDKQVRVLVRDGIPFRMVAGRPIVMESALEPVAKSPDRPKVRKLG